MFKVNDGTKTLEDKIIDSRKKRDAQKRKNELERALQRLFGLQKPTTERKRKEE